MATSFQLDVEVLGGRDSWVPEEEEEGRRGPPGMHRQWLPGSVGSEF